MGLRLTKMVLVAALAAYALLVAYGNLVDYGSNFAFVGHVMSMDSTFPGNALMGRAITDVRLWKAAYAAIIAAEALSGLLLAAGALAMAARLRGPAASFEGAKGLVYMGATLAFLVWFFGFMVIGGEYFAMWQSNEWNGQDGAFHIYMAVLGVLILVALPERDPA